jgi:hypothetical protein
MITVLAPESESSRRPVVSVRARNAIRCCATYEVC